MCGLAKLSLQNNKESQPSFDAVATKALYSIFVEERATARYFLMLYKIGFGPRNII
jgi:hypothetical protein